MSDSPTRYVVPGRENVIPLPRSLLRLDNDEFPAYDAGCSRGSESAERKVIPLKRQIFDNTEWSAC